MSKKIRMKYVQPEVVVPELNYVEIEESLYGQYVDIMRRCGYKFGKDFDIKDIAYRFIPKTWIGVMDDGVLIAVCAGSFGGEKKIKEIGTARIDGMAVSPTHRRRGIGTALSIKIVDAAYSLGYKAVYVYPHSSNKAAVRTYKKAGFRRV